jgi:hypothetical protein
LEKKEIPLEFSDDEADAVEEAVDVPTPAAGTPRRFRSDSHSYPQMAPKSERAVFFWHVEHTGAETEAVAAPPSTGDGADEPSHVQAILEAVHKYQAEQQATLASESQTSLHLSPPVALAVALAAAMGLGRVLQSAGDASVRPNPVRFTHTCGTTLCISCMRRCASQVNEQISSSEPTLAAQAGTKRTRESSCDKEVAVDEAAAHTDAKVRIRVRELVDTNI